MAKRIASSGIEAEAMAIRSSASGVPWLTNSIGLLAQAGDGDGGMRDALDRAEPVADQLQLRIKFGTARELACELRKVTHPLHRTSAQPSMVKKLRKFCTWIG